MAGHSQLYPLHWLEGQPPPFHTSPVSLAPNVQGRSRCPRPTAAGCESSWSAMHLVSATKAAPHSTSLTAEDRVALTGALQPAKGKAPEVHLHLHSPPPPPPHLYPHEHGFLRHHFWGCA